MTWRVSIWDGRKYVDEWWNGSWEMRREIGTYTCGWMAGWLVPLAARERERKRKEEPLLPPFRPSLSNVAAATTLHRSQKCYPSVARHRTKLALPPSVPSHSSLDGDLGFHKVLRAYAANPHLAVDRRYPIVCSKFGCFGSAKVRLCVPRFLVWILSDVTSSSLLNCILCRCPPQRCSVSFLTFS